MYIAYGQMFAIIAVDTVFDKQGNEQPASKLPIMNAVSTATLSLIIQ